MADLRELIDRAMADMDLPSDLAASARHGYYRRRVRRRIATAVTAAATVGAGILLWTTTGGGSQAGVSTIVPATPSPIATPPPQPSATPFRYQPVPGLTTEQATALVDKCANAARDPVWNIVTAQARLQVMARDKYGTSALISGPERGNPSQLLILRCQLWPNGTVDQAQARPPQYRDNALSAPVMPENDGGGLVDKQAASFGLPATAWTWAVDGRVARNVVRMTWTNHQGQHVAVAVRNGFYIARSVSLNGITGELKDSLSAFDAAGNEVSTTPPLSAYYSNTKPITTWP